MTEAADITIVDWKDTRDILSRIRRRVFIDEQQVPEDLEWDALDQDSTHFLARVDSTAVATARLTPAGQIGRMAVLPAFRHRGIGSAMLRSVIDRASRSGFKRVFLHAQVQVIGFYQQHGFTAEGEIFQDAGIEHRAMFKDVC